MSYNRGELGIEPKKELVHNNELEGVAFEIVDEKKFELHVQKRVRDVDEKAVASVDDTRKEYNDVSEHSGLSKQVVGVLDRATMTNEKLEKMFHGVFQLADDTKQAILKGSNLPSRENPSQN